MKNQILLDKSLIENLSKDYTNANLDLALYNLEEIVDNSTIQISNSNKLINLNNVQLMLAGDFATNTTIENSELDVYLIIKSGQIELNSIKVLQSKKVKFFKRFKDAWNNYKLSKKNRRRFFLKRKKKEKDYITQENLSANKQQLYTIQSLKEDYFNKISQQLTNLSVIYNYPDRITILAKEELGYKINLIPAFSHDDGEFRVWDNANNKFKYIYLNNALSLLNEKNDEVNNYSQNNNIFFKCIKVYKGLANNIFQTTQLSFVEDLIYNCPNEIFENNLYNSFIMSLNYLKNAHIEDFFSIYNQQNTIYNQHSISIYEVKSFLKSITDMMQFE